MLTNACDGGMNKKFNAMVSNGGETAARVFGQWRYDVIVLSQPCYDLFNEGMFLAK